MSAAGDLLAIAKPAQRALASQGIRTLADAAERTEQELLSLHGVGPRAVRLIAEALHASGRAFRAV